MTKKPTVFVTRRLPDEVEARLTRDYNAVLNADDVAYDSEALIAKSHETGADAILTYYAIDAARWLAERE